MRGRVDAACKAGDHRKAGLAQIARQPLGEACARHGGVARTDDGDGRLVKDADIALYGDERRRVLAVFQLRRIIRLAHADEPRAHARDGLHLALGLVQRHGADGPRAAAPDIEVGQHFQRIGGGTAEQDQVAESDGADIVGADEAQPVEPLAVGKANTVFRLRTFFHPLAPILLSVPARSRLILA